MDKLEYSEKYGVYFRPDESDRYVLKQVYSEYKDLTINEGDLVLDLGANAGFFTNMAEKKGAKCIAVEPIPSSIAVFKKNNPDSWLYEAAVTYDPDEDEKSQKEIDIYMSKSLAMCSVFKIRGRDAIKVKTVDIRQLYSLNPTVIKMDIESAEYQILQCPIPKSVREMSIEFTYRLKEHDVKAIQCWKLLVEQGFKFKGVDSEEDLFFPGNPNFRGSLRTRAKTFHAIRA